MKHIHLTHGIILSDQAVLSLELFDIRGLVEQMP
jgi:hypothetical protein